MLWPESIGCEFVDEPAKRSASAVYNGGWTERQHADPRSPIQLVLKRYGKEEGVPGLATSVYAASEGLSVLVLDCRSSGGQAGASARIENYLGFPTGISVNSQMPSSGHNQRHRRYDRSAQGILSGVSTNRTRR